MSHPRGIRLGVSSCLLGESVRYDAGHKRDALLADVLGPHVGWVAVCPEVEIGLGVPRPTLWLAGSPKAPRLMLPVEEEGRLTDPGRRENFIERVFAMARWRAFLARRPRARDLVAFHAAQKFAVLAHSPAHYLRLGRLVASAGRALKLAEYGRALMGALAVRATRGRHARRPGGAGGGHRGVPAGPGPAGRPADAGAPSRPAPGGGVPGRAGST